ncbi:flavin reductase (DIM6/NTAB) family NADH-FMN oxidoreductase RutF [Naumannella halotolerans]|uniref:Flavin reductase (DIM6/NTAB) family NADH-FMN oxidoreductase RutF n=2 Tax=Naumannella halotolerans TaxID=993414 RepID=A0A4R7JAZ1_9ACTN|nr:flavin reductase (DIM6/NTAB) family NADH-FMN oxidoreductase RutF [Naumannella halotolerans]
MSWDHPWAESALPLDQDHPPVAIVPPVPTDPAALRGMFAQHPDGITAVAACPDGATPVGMVVTSFSVGISFDPPLVLFSAQSSSRTWRQLAGASRLGVSVLAAQHAVAVRQLASRSGDRFAGIDIHRTESGAVFVDGARLWLECSIYSETEVGDHRLVLLEVHSASSHRTAAPLIYHDHQTLVLDTEPG